MIKLEHYLKLATEKKAAGISLKESLLVESSHRANARGHNNGWGQTIEPRTLNTVTLYSVGLKSTVYCSVSPHALKGRPATAIETAELAYYSGRESWH